VTSRRNTFRLEALAAAIVAGALAACSLLVETDSLSCKGVDDCIARSDAHEDAVDAPNNDASGQTDTGSDVAPEAESGAALPRPLAYWKFDDGAGLTALDSSGNGNTGTLQNGAAWAPAKLGAGVALSGTDQYVHIPTSAIFDGITDTVSVTAWIYRSSAQTGFRAAVHRQVGTGSADAIYLGFRDNQYFAGINTTDAGEVSLVGTTAPIGAWTHMALTYDGKTIRSFVDGQEQSSAPQTGSIAPGQNPVTIGAGLNDGVPSEYLHAVVDDVRIYDAVLTATQIAVLASAK
jgi:hypothetical protein